VPRPPDKVTRDDTVREGPQLHLASSAGHFAGLHEGEIIPAREDAACMSVEPAPTTEARPPSPRLGLLPMIIFGSRWLQLPLYLGLIVAQCVYIVLFLKELWHLSWHAIDLTEQQIMMSVLALIDVVMISNLLVMVIVGGYETFVSRLDLQGHPDEPEWLGHVNASVLKIKLAMAIIGISSIALLRTFIEAGNLGSSRTDFTETGVMWQVLIHLTFIVSALGIAYVDKLSDSGMRKHAE